MDQLMLLAQLAGEGKKTEAILRSHGFENLESIVNVDSRELAEKLEISDKAAIRMVHQAEELMESSPKDRQRLDSPRSRKPAKQPKSAQKPPSERKAQVKKETEIETTLLPNTTPAPPTNPVDIEEIKLPGRSREAQPGVTAAELSALRPEPEPSATTGKPMTTAAEAPPNDSKEMDSHSSFWHFG